MGLEKARTRPQLLVAAVLAGTVVPLATPVAADTGSVPLGMASSADVMVDEAHGQPSGGAAVPLPLGSVDASTTLRAA